MSTVAIDLRGVEIRYGKNTAVHPTSLQIHEGEVHVLLGRSGSGKTTLLRAIAGFERVHQGSLSIKGKTVDDGAKLWTPPERRNVGVVFQDYALFPHLSVGQNVRFGAPRMSDQELQTHLERVGLGAYQDRPTSALSGGEQQRVSLARALASRPDILLFDEPFSNLDRQLRHQLRKSTLRLLRETGTTAVFVTHDASEALALGDRLSVLHQGRVLQTGPPATLYEEPATQEVAQSTGEVYLMEARLAGGGKARCVLGEVPLRCASEGGSLLALRPEQIAIARQGTNMGPECTLLGHGNVEGRTYQGATVLLDVRVGETLIHAQVPAHETPEGERVELWLKGAAALV